MSRVWPQIELTFIDLTIVHVAGELGHLCSSINLSQHSCIQRKSPKIPAICASRASTPHQPVEPHLQGRTGLDAPGAVLSCHSDSAGLRYLRLVDSNGRLSSVLFVLRLDLVAALDLLLVQVPDHLE